MSEEIPQSKNFSSEDIELIKKHLEGLSDPEIKNKSEYNYIFDDHNKVKKHTDAQYEIHINLTANILENIPGAEFPQSKDLMINNYFIPVPSGHDYVEYIDAFVNYIQQCMQSSADKASDKE